MQMNLINFDNYPGHANANSYLQNLILNKEFKSVMDIGGGSNPIIDYGFIQSNHIDYYLIDISKTELEKANNNYIKFCVDVTEDEKYFLTIMNNIKVDLIFTHMFLEHIENPIQAHKNFFNILNPGGLCVHFFPTKANIPLFLNSILPEYISKNLVNFFQPSRDVLGAQGKFKTYYKFCGYPNKKTALLFQNLGYEVLEFNGYIGHPYYDRFRLLAWIERKLRNVFLFLGIPVTSTALLVLRKRSS